MQSSLRPEGSGGLQLLVCFLLLYSRPGSCGDINTHDGQGQVASEQFWSFQEFAASVSWYFQLILQQLIPEDLFWADEIAEEVLTKKVEHLNRLHLQHRLCQKDEKAFSPTAATGVRCKQEEKLGLLYPKSPTVKVSKDRCFVPKAVPKAPKQEATHPTKMEFGAQAANKASLACHAVSMRLDPGLPISSFPCRIPALSLEALEGFFGQAPTVGLNLVAD